MTQMKLWHKGTLGYPVGKAFRLTGIPLVATITPSIAAVRSTNSSVPVFMGPPLRANWTKAFLVSAGKVRAPQLLQATVHQLLRGQGFPAAAEPVGYTLDPRLVGIPQLAR